jgi:predicted NBD/HSP70 family sugar kinase
VTRQLRGRSARVLWWADALEPRKVLVIDIGGTSVKLLASGQHERRMFPSGRKMMPDKMVRKTLEMVEDWDYSVVSIGYPGPVLPRPADLRAIQSGARMGGLRFCRRISPPDQGRE